MCNGSCQLSPLGKHCRPFPCYFTIGGSFISQHTLKPAAQQSCTPMEVWRPSNTVFTSLSWAEGGDMQFITYCAYRGRLESAFLAAELASATAAETRPQPPGMAGEEHRETPKSQKGAARQPCICLAVSRLCSSGACSSPCCEILLGFAFHGVEQTC